MKRSSVICVSVLTVWRGNMHIGVCCCVLVFFFFFQAEDGIRDLVRSRGLGEVYERQACFTFAGSLK